MIRGRGFTVVELLIVIVIVAILTAITVVAYNGIQSRSRDTARLQAINSIRKGLELYRAVNDKYPAAINSGMSNSDYGKYPGSAWESSYHGVNTWLSALRPFMGNTIPVDAFNDDTHFIYYYFYTNNTGVCGASTPNCYVLGISKLDGTDPLSMPEVYTACADAWRCTTAIRPVWRQAY